MRGQAAGVSGAGGTDASLGKSVGHAFRQSGRPAEHPREGLRSSGQRTDVGGRPPSLSSPHVKGGKG